MTTLGSAPGGQSLIAALTSAITNLSLLYAGTPDECARLHLETYVSAIEPGIIKAVGGNNAPIILDAIRGAVMGRKHEIEGGAPVSG